MCMFQRVEYMFVSAYCFTDCTFILLQTWLIISTNNNAFSTSDILIGFRCGCGCGYGYEHGCRYCSGWGYAHVRGWGRGCSLARWCWCRGADWGNSLAGMLSGMVLGAAEGGNLRGTWMCRNAENHTAAHHSSHLDISSAKEMSGKHEGGMSEEECWSVENSTEISPD